MKSRRSAFRGSVRPRHSIWNLPLNNTYERALAPKSILRNPSSHSTPKKSVRFRDRDWHSYRTVVSQPSCRLDGTGTTNQRCDYPVAAVMPAYLSGQGKPEDHRLSKEYVPTARKIDESHRPDGGLLSKCFSKLVHGEFGSSRTQYTNKRREVDSLWYPNHRDILPTAPSSAPWPLPNETTPLRFLSQNNFGLLLHRPITGMELRWDLLTPLSRVDNWLNRVSFLDGPALGSNVSSVQIHFRESRLWRLQQIWGPIVVRAKGPDQPITLRHLLDEIFNYFQVPIKDINYSAAAAQIRSEDIVDSWRRRNYNTYYQWSFQRSPYMHDPFIRRVDFLLGFSLFQKLRLGSISGQYCNLILSIR